jgi:hypothetical protein
MTGHCRSKRRSEAKKADRLISTDGGGGGGGGGRTRTKITYVIFHNSPLPPNKSLLNTRNRT